LPTVRRPLWCDYLRSMKRQGAGRNNRLSDLIDDATISKPVAIGDPSQ